jgi:uncharacterized repeat protein (TIGR03803 family)
VRVGSTLYGAASTGGLVATKCGAGGCGAIFSLSTSGKGFKVLYQFQGPPDLSSPYQIVAGASGTLYGVAQSGGTIACSYLYFGCGGVFSLAPSSGKYVESVLYSFNGPPSDGAAPQGVTPYAGTLWGATDVGGNASYGENLGTIFQLAPAGGTYSEVEDLAMHVDSGIHPQFALTEYNDALYAVATGGGPSYTACASEGCGAIVKVTP